MEITANKSKPQSSPRTKAAFSARLAANARERWQLYLLVLAPLIYLFIFKYVPMYGAIIAFKNYVPTKGIWGSEWVGMHYFVRFFESYEFWRIMKNTLWISLYSLVAGFPIPIILALSLNYVMNSKVKKFVQMVTYAPHFISVVVMVGIILQLLDSRIGLAGILMNAVGLEPINFMAVPEYFSHIYVWSGIWQHAGFSCIIYLATLASIDPSLHEAAVVDGATKLQRMWYIDIPGIMSVAIILLILNVGNILDLGFEKVLLMQNPLNLSASEIIDTYVYKVGLTSTAINYSYSTAIGLFKSIVGFILLIMINNLARRVGQSSLW